VTGNEFAGPGGLHDIADIADTDAWLDAVSRREAPDGNPLAAALSTLLADADREYRPIVSMPDVARPRNRGGRTAFAAVVTAGLLVTAGTAAAQPGTAVHRLLFGHHAHSSTSRSDVASRANALLDQAASLIDAAQPGALSDENARQVADLLAQAHRLIAALPDHTARAQLLARLRVITGRLAAATAADGPAAKRVGVPLDPPSQASSTDRPSSAPTRAAPALATESDRSGPSQDAGEGPGRGDGGSPSTASGSDRGGPAAEDSPSAASSHGEGDGGGDRGSSAPSGPSSAASSDSHGPGGGRDDPTASAD